MSDLERMKAFFDALPLRYKELDALNQYGETPHTSKYDGSATFDTILRIDNGIGYTDFYCNFYFLQGTFQGHGVWE